jgi:hypothetical protein
MVLTAEVLGTVGMIRFLSVTYVNTWARPSRPQCSATRRMIADMRLHEPRQTRERTQEELAREPRVDQRRSPNRSAAPT